MDVSNPELAEHIQDALKKNESTVEDLYKHEKGIRAKRVETPAEKEVYSRMRIDARRRREQIASEYGVCPLSTQCKELC